MTGRIGQAAAVGALAIASGVIVAAAIAIAITTWRWVP